MKKSLIIFSLIACSFMGYAQKNHIVQNPISQPMILDFLKNDEAEVPKTQIMTDYLKNYQEKNTIKIIEMPVLGLDALKKLAKNLENVDNMIMVKPNLAELIRMPITKPYDNTYYTMKIINSGTNKEKPLN